MQAFHKSSPALLPVNSQILYASKNDATVEIQLCGYGLKWTACNYVNCVKSCAIHAQMVQMVARERIHLFRITEYNEV